MDPGPNERALLRWARAAVVVYLSVTVAVVPAALLTNGLELDVDDRTKEGLLLAMVFLTLPVSAAYFIIGTFGSSRPPSPDEISLGGLSLTAVLYFLGYVFLAVVNAGVFGFFWCGISGCSGGGFWWVLQSRTGKGRTVGRSSRR